jgi:nucleotide-binding universal stress UspA family protein
MTDTAAEFVKRSDLLARGTRVASIAVYVDFDVGSDGRIKIAADWASKFGAVLIGVAGWLPGREPGSWFEYELERPEDRIDRITAELEKLAERFRSIAHQKVEVVEWRPSFHFPREVIPAEARAADLIIIGPRTVSEDAYHAFDAGMVILNAGRPVLVVPDRPSADAGERILIAWKDAREARHAVQDALPYLALAEDVTLVAITEEVQERAVVAQLGDVETYLLRHGIKVRAKSVLHPKGSISDQLRSVAKSEGADLIVAGAYGHTRLGEWVFGGVTRGLLDAGDVCCLFSN